MEEEKKDVGAEATTNIGAENEPETKKSLMDLINGDKELQSQFDKLKTDSIKTAITNAKAKWEEDNKTKQAEAEKLAKMDEDQKKNYELEQWKARAEKAEKRNSISDLKSETIKQATEKGISLDFINPINFEYETAETIKNKLESLEKAIKKEREIAISEYSKETPPQTGDKVNTTPKSGFEEFMKNYN